MKKSLALFVFLLVITTVMAQNKVFDTITFFRGGKLYKVNLWKDSIQLNNTKYYFNNGTGSSQWGTIPGSEDDIHNLNSGFTGIGLTNPIHKLHVFDTINEVSLFSESKYFAAIQGTSKEGSGVEGFSISGSGIYGNSSSGPGLFGFSNNGSGVVAVSLHQTGLVATSSTGYAALFPNGNVGIGISNPTDKLSINGVISATGGNSTQWNAKQGALGMGTTNQWLRGDQTWQTISGTSSNLWDRVIGATNSIHNLNIENVGIGTTDLADFQDVFHVRGNPEKNVWAAGFSYGGTDDNTKYNGIGIGNPNIFSNNEFGIYEWGTQQPWMVFDYDKQILHFGGQMTMNASDGKVGVNNTNPTTVFDVGGVITATGGNSTSWNAKEPGIGIGTTNQWYRGDKSWQTLPSTPESIWARITGATDNIYHVNSGNVGIGTTTPNNAKLEIYSTGSTLRSTSTTGTSIFGTSTSGTAINGNSSSSFGMVGESSTGIGVKGISGSSTAGYFSSTSGTAINGTTTSGYAGLFMGGKVGIGSATPNALLHVQSLASASNPFFISNNKGVGTDSMLLVNSKGWIGLGTTNPVGLITAINNVATNGASIQVTNNGGTGGAQYLMSDIGSGSSWSFKATTTGMFKVRDVQYSLDVMVFEKNSLANAIYLKSGGNVGLGTTNPNEKLDINSNKIILETSNTPSNSTASGIAGTICWDANYIYVCVSTNTWKRTLISTW